MRLLTVKGQLDLPSDFSFTIEQNSPAFSPEGTQSIPVTVPPSSRNLQVLDFPTRLGRSEKYVRKLSAKLEAGLLQKDGQFVIESASRDSGIVGALMLNESDLYTRIKDVTLKSIFGKIIRNDFASDPEPVKAWLIHIVQCMTGEVTDDFTAFPVAVNYSESSGYQVLNCPDYTTDWGSDPWALKWQARTITSGDKTVNLPVGYGITPFLWMYRVIELLFAEYGYTVGNNPFKFNMSPYRKVVLMNNTADTICAGKLRYSDLVPSCTVSEFLQLIEKKYNFHAYINAETKVVDIIALDAVLTSGSDLDISEFVNGDIKQSFLDPQEVSLSSETDLEGAKPAADTIFDLSKKYNGKVYRLTEKQWRSYDWGDSPVSTHNLIFRKATGEYYDVYYQRAGGPANITRLGSNYFRYFTNKYKAVDCKAEDVMPPMVYVCLGVTSYIYGVADGLEVNIVCPFIGQSRHLNSVVDGEEEDSELKMMFAFASGKATAEALPAFGTIYRGTMAAKYYMGTTQKYDNAGNDLGTLDLTPTDLYRAFFQRWNSLLRNSCTEIECRVDYPVRHLMSLRMDKLKLLKGQLLLPESLSYSVSRTITHNTSKFLLVKDLVPLIPDETYF